MAVVQQPGNDDKRVAQIAQGRRSPQVDPNGMDQGLASDGKGVGGQHADAALTAGPRKGPAPPGFGQMQPGVRRGLMTLNVVGSEHLAEDGLPAAQAA